MLEKVKEIALGAGRLIMGVYSSGRLDATSKEDGSPVTRADRLSSDYICAALARLSSFEVISEEVACGPDPGRRDFWLVDPLDGTKDFLAGNGEFAVCIALLRDLRPVLGVIHGPATGETYFAESGGGAFLEAGAGPRRLPLHRPEGLVMARSRFHDSPATQAFARRNSVNSSVPIGAALKFGRLASGAVNVYPRYNYSREWDIAAGHAILLEAGGGITDLSTGRAPAYNKPEFRNGFFVAYAGGVTPDRLLLTEE